MSSASDISIPISSANSGDPSLAFSGESTDSNPQINTEKDLDDPLSIKQLSLNFDYLIYRINDKIKGLSELTYESIVNKQNNCHDFLLVINTKIAKLNLILESCDVIEKEFLKLEQIGYIISEFRARIMYLEREFERI